MSQPARPVHIAVGGMLVLIGSFSLIQRAGLAPWSAGVSLWPLLLIGFGVTKLVETRARHQRRGYIPLLFGIWLLAGNAGWILLRDSWPLLLIAIGVVIVADVLWAPAGPRIAEPVDGNGASLLIVGVVLAVMLVSDTGSGFRSPSVENGDGVHVFSVMTRSRQASYSPQFRGGEINTLMGGAEIDLRGATVPPGEVISLDVHTVMGGTILRVPEQWNVDVQALAVAGGVVDRRPPRQDSAATSPRIVLRGFVVMGRFVIRS